MTGVMSSVLSKMQEVRCLTRAGVQWWFSSTRGVCRRCLSAGGGKNPL